MRTEITPSVEWKLNHAVEVMAESDDVREYSFNRRVEIFIEQWEERIQTGGNGWADSAIEHRNRSEDHTHDASETLSNRPVPEFEEESRFLDIGQAVAKRVEAIAAAENPRVPVGQFSFNDTLLVALEAWNSYATELNEGWIPVDPRVTGRA